MRLLISHWESTTCREIVLGPMILKNRGRGVPVSGQWSVVSCQLPVRATPFHQAKSLFLKILPITHTCSRACRKFLCKRLIRKNKGKGGGVGRLSVASCQWSVFRKQIPRLLGRLGDLVARDESARGGQRN